MGTHAGEPTGAEYFALHAWIALEDVRSDAAGLEALRAAAVEFVATLPAPVVLCGTCGTVLGGMWDTATTCEPCQHDAKRSGATDAPAPVRPANWADMGSSERDLWEDRQARAAAKRAGATS